MSFPRQFLDDLRTHADIVVVIQDYVSLKKTGATYKGLCPFHGEKTPSFHVNRDKGFFHCFGCGVGGDVFKFLELHEKVGFADAVRQLAQRFGVPLPEMAQQTDEQRAGAGERETLLKVHEAAALWFRDQLAGPGGARVRGLVAARGVSDGTADAMGLGFAPAGREGLRQALLKQGFTPAVLLRAGLVVQRDDGSVIDRFRGRLMIPIRRDTGSVIAFGGRAIEADQQPKYLNSPETPIYTKGRTLYGLDLTKSLIRQRGFAILVEGYFDFGQVYQAGLPVVASCGTALTSLQVKQLQRFTSKVVLSYDPDAAGEGAAAKSSELFVADGFDVAVAVLPDGQDPDTFIQRHGAAGYGERLKQSRPYLEYLLDRAATSHNLNSDEGRVKFLAAMLSTAARIPDPAMRDRFADRLAFRANVTDEVVRAKIREAAVQRQTTVALPAAPAAALGKVTNAEKGLIWQLFHEEGPALTALAQLDDDDLRELAVGRVLDLARKLNEDRRFSPSSLLERLTREESTLVTAAASEREPHVHDAESCVRIIQRLRCERDYSAIQREIWRLQERGATEHGAEIDALWKRKHELWERMQGLI